MNEEFIKLLELEYNELKIGLAKASIEGKGTPQEIADRKEELFHALFEKYFPFPFTITKGNIIDSFNKRSASIDCIILDPSHPHTIDQKNKKASVIFADLTRVKNGVILPKDQNEYTYKIPTIIYAEKTYDNINTLIENILEYYKENKIKRLFQFDIIVAGDYTIINSCKGLISCNNSKGLFLEKTGERTLAVLLFLMANMPLVQPLMSENIYNIYLNNIIKDASYSEEWNSILEDIENN